MTALDHLLLSGRGYCGHCGKPVETFELGVYTNSRSVGYPICNDCYNAMFSPESNYFLNVLNRGVRQRQ